MRLFWRENEDRATMDDPALPHFCMGTSQSERRGALQKLCGEDANCSLVHLCSFHVLRFHPEPNQQASYTFNVTLFLSQETL